MSSRRPGPSVRTRVTETFADRSQRGHEDRLATEEPLEVRLTWPGVAAARVWVTMRTPGHDFELAAGWVRHEGLVDDAPGAIARVAYCTDADLAPEQEFNVVTVTLAAPPLRDPGHRHTALSAGSSACGVCGADSVADALAVAGARPWAGALPDPAVVLALPDRLRGSQPLFERTGGVHAAALVTADGDLLVVREDVGRHNAVDKVTGAQVLDGRSPAAACLLVSGRAGFELVQKAASAGVGSLVAVGAPTSLSVRLAREHSLALWGFASTDRAVRYA
ncbi:formate dehydrogenase accessory sulfurtransferase FdhD [Nocardioides acrostichi]|uniref:Formate dehydrogenase accessory sulfurtransferase FdhD n=1 Tax=Nocardioides acrostichi TaxID=2784339 RepID=A0A930YCQ9_9ACTN|nr:formate dehydrogenase accessory sulfurtransferase FdhD [Nocardioides acrostichi]MBF4163763.1 formate dehydrogenase accessory sulfurtransferase FdhD [Nocardioides acrostichi]